MLKLCTLITTRLKFCQTLITSQLSASMSSLSQTYLHRQNISTAVLALCNSHIAEAHKSLKYNYGEQRLYQCRFYSKKPKGGKGSEKKTSQKNVVLSDEEMISVISVDKMKEEMIEVVEELKKEFIQHVNIHHTTGTFNSLIIATDDGKFPLNQLGQIIQKNPSLIQISMASSPQYIKPVMTTILESGMGINPQQDKDSIYLQLPPVTREQREKLAQSTKTLCNRAKEKLRDVHNKYNKKLKHSQLSHSEDLIHNLQTVVYNNMASFGLQIDHMTKLKQDELLQKK